MAKTVMADRERPLSPHLWIYHWHVTMALSIIHRLTGLALGAGIVMLTWWLIAAASGPVAFESADAFLGGFIGRLILFGFTLSVVIHFLNGVRHLFWDLGLGLEKATATASGWLVVVSSIVLTLLIWIAGYGLMGGAA